MNASGAVHPPSHDGRGGGACGSTPFRAVQRVVGCRTGNLGAQVRISMLKSTRTKRCVDTARRGQGSGEAAVGCRFRRIAINQTPNEPTATQL